MLVPVPVPVPRAGPTGPPRRHCFLTDRRRANALLCCRVPTAANKPVESFGMYLRNLQDESRNYELGICRATGVWKPRKAGSEYEFLRPAINREVQREEVSGEDMCLARDGMKVSK